MTAALPTREPRRLVAGDTLDFKRALARFPASTWTLTYNLQSPTATIAEITATASGDDFRVTVAAATTAGWSAGVYTWHAFVTSGAVRHRVGSGTMRIEADPATASGGLDGRSHARKVLDALEALLEGKASLDQKSYEVAGRKLERLTPAELLQWRDKYRREVASERQAERRKRTGSPYQRMTARFE